MENRCPYCMTPAGEGEKYPGCGKNPLDYVPGFHHLLPGAVLRDRYLIGGVLGEGGFGITYLAWDLQAQLRVGVKEYFPRDRAARNSLSETEAKPLPTVAALYAEGLDRFAREAELLTTLREVPQVIHVLEFFRANGTAYIVMEYVQGLTLTQWVAREGGRLDSCLVLEKMKPVFSALQRIHDLGLIHRDISPDNMMLEADNIRLLDFGSAREGTRKTETLPMTLRHGYAPVEQYQIKGQGPQTDVYSLSATIYYCITGVTPPHALDRLCADMLQTPRALGVQMDPRQEQVLLYGLGIRPHRRFQTVKEMARELYRW